MQFGFGFFFYLGLGKPPVATGSFPMSYSNQTSMNLGSTHTHCNWFTEHFNISFCWFSEYSKWQQLPQDIVYLKKKEKIWAHGTRRALRRLLTSLSSDRPELSSHFLSFTHSTAGRAAGAAGSLAASRARRGKKAKENQQEEGQVRSLYLL